MSKQNQADLERAKAARKLIEEYMAATGSFNIPFKIITKTDDLIRFAKYRGLKPEFGWKREDFQDLLNVYPELRELTTAELRALFLRPEDTIGGFVYYKRLDVKDVQHLRHHDQSPYFPLAVSEANWLMAKQADTHPEHHWAKDEKQAIQWVHDEEMKLAKIWQNLGENKGEKL